MGKKAAPVEEEEVEKEPSETWESHTGEFRFPDGEIYHGDIMRSSKEVYQLHGQGEMTLGADCFTGEYSQGKLLKGVYKFGNGDTYSGSFKDNQFHGEGTYTWKQGGKIYDKAARNAPSKIYEGMWHNGLMCGPCKWTNFSPNNPNRIFRGVAWKGEYRSKFAHQQEDKGKWKEFYQKEIIDNLVEKLNCVLSEEDDEKAEKALSQFLVELPQQAEGEEEGEEQAAPAEPLAEESVVEGPFPQADKIKHDFLKEMIEGLTAEEGPISEINVPLSNSDLKSMDGGRLKCALECYRGQVVEIIKLETGKTVTLCNVNMDSHDLGHANWKFVHYDLGNDVEEPEGGGKKKKK